MAIKLKQQLIPDTVIKWFAALCTLSLLCTETVYTYFLYTPLLMASMAVGCVLLLWLFLVERKIYTRPYAVFFFVFCVSYGVTILLNRQSGIVTNCGQLVYTAFYFFIFFCAYSSLQEETKAATLKLLSWIVFVFSAAVALASLGMMFAGYSAEIDHLGTEITIGFIHRNSSMQLVGATTGPSSLSELCMMGMISAWYLFHKPNGMPKWPCTLAGIILFFTIAAANAYSALMSMTAFAVLLVLCLNLGKALRQNGKTIRLVGKTVVQIVLACVIVIGGYFGVQQLETIAVNGVQQIIYDDDNKAPGQQGERPPKVTITRDVETSANGVRSSIWREGIKLFATHPLGVTNSHISVKVFYGVPDYEYRNLHNGYLTLLVASGVIGFLSVMSFGVLFFIRAMRYLCKCTDREKCKQLSVLIAVCAAILAGELVNGCFVLWRGLVYIALWLLLGQICGIIAQPKTKKIDAPKSAQ
ncbi:MAG: O-antigen ligase family protein [Firmicutes bacterium]|nr:O-antigen ligase family protein [Bacillota bacterium]